MTPIQTKKYWQKPKWQRHLKHGIEAFGVYFIFGIFRLLPLDAASWLGGVLAKLLGPHTKFHIRAIQNLSLVYPQMSLAKQQKTLRKMWENLGRTFGEMPHLHRLFKKNRVTCHGFEHLKNCAINQQAGIFVSSHSANWEVLALATWAHGQPLSAVYRKPNNHLVDWLLRRMRRQVTPQLIAKGASGARQILQCLKQNGLIGLLVDQKLSGGLALPFLGHVGLTTPAPAQFALRHNAALIPALIKRTKGARFDMTLLAPLVAQGATDAAKIENLTQQINDILSAHIHANPSQWLWIHRRWA